MDTPPLPPRRAFAAPMPTALAAVLLAVVFAGGTIRVGSASPVRTGEAAANAQRGGSASGDLGARRAVPLYTFSGPDGEAPEGGLLGDRAGVLYGVTQQGGAHNAGTVFKLTPPAGGQGAWTLTTLHAFSDTNGDGDYPSGPLVRDAAGALYGTTAFGGACSDCGTVFKLSPPAPGKTAWTEAILHQFRDANGDGTWPGAGVVLDANGNVYGTAQYGGLPGSCYSGCGIVYELTPPGPGQTTWQETILHSFTGTNGDGREPSSALTRAADGTLYGTTPWGGATDFGLVYQLTPPAPGQTTWTETILHTFLGWSDPDGAAPYAGVVLDKRGALIGATYGGGLPSDCAPYGCGTVFRLDPPAVGKTAWSIDLLYAFTGLTYGFEPTSDVAVDPTGALFGMTQSDAFRLTAPSGPGPWIPSLVHDFGARDVGGRTPTGALIEDGQGNLYGTAWQGGNHTSCPENRGGCGVIFELLK